MVLQFVPFSSAIDTAFWYQLSKKKLDEFKLDDKPIDIWGYYSKGGTIGLLPIVNIDYSAFGSEHSIPLGSTLINGCLINTNTLEDFKSRDKKALLQSVGINVWKAIKDGQAIENPTLLQYFLCLTFSDLKKYDYYYWVAFPCLTYPEISQTAETRPITSYFSSNQLNEFVLSYDSLSNIDKVAFLVYMDEDKCCVSPLKNFQFLKDQNKKIALGFADPSTVGKYPGWPLRNLLALVSYHWGKYQNNWDILCYREFKKDGKRHFEHSVVISVKFTSDSIPEECPDFLGWEKNRNILAPRKVNLSSDMNPEKLADAAVDLNLKLMKWRLSPDLRLDLIKSSRCLLFGAGTLGCNVARCLMAWGIRKITFVDNANVSYSNPVRQTLFSFKDCHDGGRVKATAASEELRRIFPGLDATGFNISVPMPGHSVSEKVLKQTKADVSKIEELVDTNDIIFLLMDTRESRWLPTLLGAAKEKIVVNAALGFDTYLVMRHGFKGAASSSSGDASVSKNISGAELGCYFCNDVTAPGNSVQDRTLDQQCTVTRPGVSFIAAAMAVELMVSILQHSEKGSAPAPLGPQNSKSDDLSTTELGIVPHQIRGYLHEFQNCILTSKAFDSCTGCSPKVIEKYKKEGFDFLLRVFNESKYLEEVTGLTELVSNIDQYEICAFSDDESI